MAHTRIACPECGAGLKSQSGFTEGETVCCPKCETYFTVEELAEESPTPKKTKLSTSKAADTPRKPMKASADDEDDIDDYQPKKKKKKKRHDDDDESQQWYKNSSLRYAILGVLIITMLVLGSFLYFKKTREAKDTASSDSGNSSTEPGASGSPPITKGQPGTPGATPNIPAEQPPKDDPAANTPGSQKFKALLIGKWRTEFEGVDKIRDSATVEYKKTGEYVVTLHDTDERRYTFTGTWRVIKPFYGSIEGEQVGIMVEITIAKRAVQFEVVFNPPDCILQQYFGPPTGVQLYLLTWNRVKE